MARQWAGRREKQPKNQLKAVRKAGSRAFFRKGTGLEVNSMLFLGIHRSEGSELGLLIKKYKKMKHRARLPVLPHIPPPGESRNTASRTAP